MVRYGALLRRYRTIANSRRYQGRSDAVNKENEHGKKSRECIRS
jgi:hypothetical protein